MVMCAERLWFMLVAIFMGLVMGLAGSQMFGAAFLVQLVIMVMMLVRGFTGKCPSLTILRQILPSCNEGA